MKKKPPHVTLVPAVKPAPKSRDEYIYENLVNNIATIIRQQCNLYARQVPDVVEKLDKAGRLKDDVLKALQEQQ